MLKDFFRFSRSTASAPEKLVEDFGKVVAAEVIQRARPDQPEKEFRALFPSFTLGD